MSESKNTTTVFNGAPNYAGYIESWKGGKATVTISRGDSTADASAGINAGFMVSQYAVQFQRTLQNQYFLNIENAVAILGRGQGTVQLTGLVGKMEDFRKLLQGGTGTGGSTTEDFCKPLIITISGNTQLNDCKGSRNNAKAGKIICSNAIINSISLGGQLQADGAEMQTASLAAQFTKLELAEEASNDADTWA